MKFTASKVFFVLLLCTAAFWFFLNAFSYRSKCEYFEGTVMEATDHQITVRISQEEESESLRARVGDMITIEKKDLLRKDDFSAVKEGSHVRVAYNWMDGRRNTPIQFYAVYLR